MKQRLGAQFYTREHSKPLLNKNNIMNVYNLHTYFCTVELFKVLKFRSPISLYSQFDLSARKDTLIITAHPSINFNYKAGVIWNTMRTRLNITDFSTKFGPLKHNLKKLILTQQTLGNQMEWEGSNNVC